MKMSPEQVKEVVTGYAVRILKSLELEIDVAVEVCSEEEIQLVLSGPDSKYIIGEDGARLDDLQYMLNRFAVMNSDKAPRVRVDCDHFRQRHEQAVVDAALRKARHVLKTGRPRTLKPLNAYFRRLVHSALAELPGIVTQSEEGEARFKRITISKTTAPPQST